MPVHIGQMTTDVIAEPSSNSSARDANEAPPPWMEEERVRTVREQHESIRLRTTSDLYDD